MLVLLLCHYVFRKLKLLQRRLTLQEQWISPSQPSKRFGLLERTFEVQVVQKDARKETIAWHFQGVVRVSNLGNFNFCVQIRDAETWVQETVGVDVGELANAAVSHQDVATALVNSEPVTCVLQVSVVASASCWSLTRLSRRLAAFASELTLQGCTFTNQVQSLGGCVPVCWSVVESF